MTVDLEPASAPLILLAAAILLILSASSLCAGVYYVDGTNGDDAASGLSWSDALASVVRALELAAADGEGIVHVAAGSYVVQETVIDYRLLLIGGYPPGGGARDHAAQTTTLDAAGAATVFAYVEGADGSLLDGFSITGATSTEWDHAIEIEVPAMIQNCRIMNNNVVGAFLWRAGTVRESAFTGNRIGLTADSDSDGGKGVRIRNNLIEQNQERGLWIGDRAFMNLGDHQVVVTGNRILQNGPGNGVELVCCPLFQNNLVSRNLGPGVTLRTVPAGGFLLGTGTNLIQTTIKDNEGPAVFVDSSSDIKLDHSILWNNDGGDVLDMPATTRIEYTLSEQPLPGPGNVSGTDPLFVAGPRGDAYLSQVSSGQAADSVAVDAGETTAVAAGQQHRTTRTDGVRDRGRVDLGYHPEPTEYTVHWGADPASPLPPHLTGITLPVLDPGAIPAGPALVFYEVDTDSGILLNRRGPDIDIRFDYQRWDP